MRIDGKRIYLRRLKAVDAHQDYVSWLNDPVINQFLESRFTIWEQDKVRQFIVNCEQSSDNYLMGIFLHEHDLHIGNIKLGPIHPVHRFAEIGLLIGNTDYHGYGYGSEAIDLICQMAFEHLNVHKVSAGAYAPNQSSIRSFLKNGFIQEGLRSRHFLYENQFVDYVLLAKWNQ